MTRRTFFLSLLTFVIVFLSLAGGGGYWLWINNPLRLLVGGNTTSLVASMFIPNKAPLVVSLLVNPDRLAALRQLLANPGDRPQARLETQQIKQGLLTSTGLEYERDIQPWIGNEITIAVTTPDLDYNPGNGQQPGYLMVVEARNGERARQFLEFYWQRQTIAGLNLQYQSYQGVQLIYGLPSNPPLKGGVSTHQNNQNLTSLSLATAAVTDRFILLANSPKVLRDAINNVQVSNLNLGNSPQYQQALNHLNTNPIVLSYVNLGELYSWLGDYSPSINSSIHGKTSKDVGKHSPNRVMAQQQSMDRAMDRVFKVGSYPDDLIVGLSVSREGLLANGVWQTGSGLVVNPPPTQLSHLSNGVSYLAGSLPLIITSKDLNSIWSAFNQEISVYPSWLQGISNSVTSLSRQWDVDLSKDIVSWIGDTFGLVLLPNEQGNSSSAGPFSIANWVFLVERTPKTISAIAQLDQLATQKGYSVGKIKTGGGERTVWAKLNPLGPESSNLDGKGRLSNSILTAHLQGVHGTVGEYEAFATSIPGIDQISQSLNPNTTATMGRKLPQGFARLHPLNNGYAFIDWQKFKPLLIEQFPLFQFVELAGYPLFNHLRSIIVGGDGGNSESHKGVMLIQLR